MNVEEFVIAFTIAYSKWVSDPDVDLVAKNGEHSVFSILQEIFPQASAIMCLVCCCSNQSEHCAECRMITFSESWQQWNVSVNGTKYSQKAREYADSVTHAAS